MHSICKIENISHFIHEKFLIFDLVFEKITIFLLFEGYFLGNFQKNRSQKPSMLEQKQGQFWNLHRIPNKTSNPDFRFLFLLFFLFQFFSGLKKVIVIFIRKFSLIKKIRRKSKIGIRSFVRNLMQIPKLSLFFFLALIVFDFYSFEGSKTHFTGEANVYIYICIY